MSTLFSSPKFWPFWNFSSIFLFIHYQCPWSSSHLLYWTCSQLFLHIFALFCIYSLCTSKSTPHSFLPYIVPQESDQYGFNSSPTCWLPFRFGQRKLTTRDQWVRGECFRVLLIPSLFHVIASWLWLLLKVTVPVSQPSSGFRNSLFPLPSQA